MKSVCKESALALASDPNFDIEQLFYYLDAHESECDLVHTLISDPYIMLSVAEGMNYRVLERHASGITAKTFKKFEDIGLEFWTKISSSNNIWYGVVAAEDLAIYYRRVHGPEIQVFRGNNAAETARSRWRKLNMFETGDEDGARRVPGKRSIDEVRGALFSIIKKAGYENRYNGKPQDSTPHFRRRMTLTKYDFYDLKLGITAAGPYKINVHYRGCRRPHEEAVSETFTRDLDRTNKILKDPQDVATEIAKWLSVHCKHFGDKYASI